MGVSIFDLLRALDTVTITTRHSTKVFTCQRRALGPVTPCTLSSSGLSPFSWELSNWELELGEKRIPSGTAENKIVHRAVDTSVKSLKLISKLLQNIFPAKCLFQTPSTLRLFLLLCCPTTLILLKIRPLLRQRQSTHTFTYSPNLTAIQAEFC